MFKIPDVYLTAQKFVTFINTQSNVYYKVYIKYNLLPTYSAVLRKESGFIITMKIEDKVEQDERIIIATRSDGSSQHRVIYYDELSEKQKEYVGEFNKNRDSIYEKRLMNSLIKTYKCIVEIDRDGLRRAGQ